MNETIKRFLKGDVVSDRMDKTLVVNVQSTKRHPETGKVIRVNKKYKVHDEREEGQAGDVVEIYEGRPKSKEKYMYLHRVIERKQPVDTKE
jgi:small subunit ribosomal protein S17